MSFTLFPFVQYLNFIEQLRVGYTIETPKIWKIIAMGLLNEYKYMAITLAKNVAELRGINDFKTQNKGLHHYFILFDQVFGELEDRKMQINKGFMLKSHLDAATFSFCRRRYVQIDTKLRQGRAEAVTQLRKANANHFKYTLETELERIMMKREGETNNSIADETARTICEFEEEKEDIPYKQRERAREGKVKIIMIVFSKDLKVKLQNKSRC